MPERGPLLKAILHSAEVGSTASLDAAERFIDRLRSHAVAWRSRNLGSIERLDGNSVYSVCREASVHSQRGRVSSGELLRFFAELSAFNEAGASAGEAMARREDLMPCLSDRTADVGFDAHYTYHTAWAARILAEIRPPRHVDVGSHLMFVALCSAFVNMEHYDFRAVQLSLSGLRTGEANLVALPWETGSIGSLSCMHVVEHVGLGRYGDQIDPQADRQAMKELARVLAPGGQLLFVVPVGRPRIQFNAHRIYDVDSVLRSFEGLDLAEFSLIPTDGSGLIRNADFDLVRAEAYACGCFRFIKRAGDAGSDQAV